MKPIAILFFLAVSHYSQATREVYPFEHIIGLSDLIVIGEINEIESNTYTFTITETLKGDVHASIRVEKFKEWLCDMRFGSYEKGQKLCLFLKKGLLSWEIINGSSGERPILEETVYLGLEKNYKLPLAEFSTAITGFCKNFKPESIPGIYKYQLSFVQTGSDEEVKAFRHSSKFAEWLYQQVNNDLLSKEASLKD